MKNKKQFIGTIGMMVVFFTIGYCWGSVGREPDIDKRGRVSFSAGYKMGFNAGRIGDPYLKAVSRDSLIYEEYLK